MELMIMRTKELEEKLIRRIIPRIEQRLIPRLTKKIVNEITKEEYPPESQFKKKFIREVKAAQRRVREGKGKTCTCLEFKRKFLKD
jgi:hypothetical protein